MKKLVWIAPALAVVSICAALALSFFPGVVETWYSRGLYPFFAAWGSWVLGWLPLPVGELLVYLFAAFVLFCGALGVFRLIRPTLKNPRRELPARLRKFALRTVVLISVIVAWFIWGWGLNYQRQSWAENLGWKASGGSLTELILLTDELVKKADEKRGRLREDGRGVAMSIDGRSWSDASLRDRVMRAYDDTAIRFPLLMKNLPPPKSVVLPEVFSDLTISGIFLPFTNEALINPGPADWTVAFTTAHESSHQRGWAREDEANFLAFLVLQGAADDDLSYSAYSMACLYAAQALQRQGSEGRQNWARIAKMLNPGIVRDWKENSAYWQKYEGVVAQAATVFNDTYLKVQGQSDGVKSYGRMVDLLLAWRRGP